MSPIRAALFCFIGLPAIALGIPVNGQQPKDCNFEMPGLFDEFPRLRRARLETPTRDPDNWRGGWNYEYIFDVARETIDDFAKERFLFTDFEKMCVFTLSDSDGLVHDRNGAAGIASARKTNDGIIHRRIYYNTNQPSDVATMRLFLHELGHHIASYVDGTFSTDDFSVGRRYNIHIRQRMAEFWAGAILYRLNKAEKGRFSLETLTGNWGHRGYTDLYLSTRDKISTLREGWLQSEYGDTPLWYYGTYDGEWIYQCPHEHPAIFSSTSTDDSRTIIDI